MNITGKPLDEIDRVFKEEPNPVYVRLTWHGLVMQHRNKQGVLETRPLPLFEFFKELARALRASMT